VPKEQLAGIERGLVAGTEYLSDVVGTPPTSPAEIRVSWSQGCEPPLLGPASISRAWAREGLMCLNAAHPQWKVAAAEDAWFPEFVAAHEQVHLWQTELGCDHEPADHRWQWLYEGMADQLAFSALVRAGVVTETDVLNRIADRGGLDPAFGPISGYERPTPRTGEAYPFFHLAARVVEQSAQGPTAWADFCTAEASGTPWEKALVDSFGIDAEEVDQLVEAERARMLASITLEG